MLKSVYNNEIYIVGFDLLFKCEQSVWENYYKYNTNNGPALINDDDIISSSDSEEEKDMKDQPFKSNQSDEKEKRNYIYVRSTSL